MKRGKISATIRGHHPTDGEDDGDITVNPQNTSQATPEHPIQSIKLIKKLGEPIQHGKRKGMP